MTITIGNRRRQEIHRLRLYDREFVEEGLKGLGFGYEALHGYCDFGFWSGYAAFAAAKPS